MEISSKTLTIMFVDLVGYTYKTTQLNREEFNQLHNIFDGMSLPIFKKYLGRVINKVGDAFLITFESPTDALLCGIKLHEIFDNYNKNKNAEELKIRIAVDHGEVLIRNESVYGDAVNRAARVEGITWPNHIFFTESVLQAINKNEINYTEVGYSTFKGIEQPVRILRIIMPSDKIERYKTMALNLLALIICIGLIYFLQQFLTNNPNFLTSAVIKIESLKP